MLLGGMEGVGIVYRIRPGSATPLEPEIDLRKTMIEQVGVPPVYLYEVVAYNDMPLIDGRRVIGFSAFHPFPGHENSAWLALRSDQGTYAIHEIPSLSGKPLIGVREVVESPFPDEAGQILYVGGYDTESQPCHDSGWIYRVGKTTAGL
jgi:hypothetical protein